MNKRSSQKHANRQLASRHPQSIELLRNSVVIPPQRSWPEIRSALFTAINEMGDFNIDTASAAPNGEAQDQDNGLQAIWEQNSAMDQSLNIECTTKQEDFQLNLSLAVSGPEQRRRLACRQVAQIASRKLAEQLEEKYDYGLHTFARHLPFLMAAAALQCAVPLPVTLPSAWVWEGRPDDEPVIILSPQWSTREYQLVVELLAAFTSGGARVFILPPAATLPAWWTGKTSPFRFSFDCVYVKRPGQAVVDELRIPGPILDLGFYFQARDYGEVLDVLLKQPEIGWWAAMLMCHHRSLHPT